MNLDVNQSTCFRGIDTSGAILFVWIEGYCGCENAGKQLQPLFQRCQRRPQGYLMTMLVVMTTER